MLRERECILRKENVQRVSLSLPHLRSAVKNQYSVCIIQRKSKQKQNYLIADRLTRKLENINAIAFLTLLKI